MSAAISDAVHCHVLFFCNGNSARSILAEALLNRLGKGKFVAYSAGIDPKSEVNPHALKLLNDMGIPTEQLRAKSWREFFTPDAPEFDFVFEVCENETGERPPDWRGQPMTSYWGVPDPAAVRGTEAEIAAAFYDAFSTLRHRIEIFASLPVYRLNKLVLKQRLDFIGTLQPELASAQRN